MLKETFLTALRTYRENTKIINFNIFKIFS